MILQYEPLFGNSEAEAVFEYMKTGGWITEYKKTEEFEDRIKTFLGVKYCSAVNNGTISLSIALLALGIKPGDKVLVPDLTMIATPNAVRLIGAIPVFVDIDTKLCMDLDRAYVKISEGGIKAVIYVTLNGRCANSKEYDAFLEYCKQKKIATIEDSAQSFGSRYDDNALCGNKCDIASFSFSTPKIISTGQGGCLVTNNDALGLKIEKIKDFGRISGGIDIHNEFGINSKFTEIQAVIGIEQIKDIDRRIARKIDIYDKYLEGIGNVVEIIENDESVVPWFVDIYIPNKAKLKEYLFGQGIGTREVYPPIHSQKVYLGTEEYPVTNEYSNSGLWLPSSFNLTNKDIKFICSKIKEFYNA